MEYLDRILIRQAKMVLEFNWTGEYTRPGPRLYPHQWSWDSALISIGYSRYAPERAAQELLHLFRSQWKNGLLPHIVFDPGFSEYFPGIGFWDAHLSPDSPDDHQTSGVVQPPVHATAALELYRRAGAETRPFLTQLFPKLVAWHDYLYRERDPEGEGLVYIRHPWESGMDNSPIWDPILLGMQLSPEEIPAYQRADTHIVDPEDRPEMSAYDRYAYLIRLFAGYGYDEAEIRNSSPFLVQNVLFNALLCRAERDLAELARELGEDPTRFEIRAAKTARAMNGKLWDEKHGTYLDYDLRSGTLIRVYAASGYLPLFAGIPDGNQAQSMLRSMEHHGFYPAKSGGICAPSYDMYGYGFSPVQYWRGPVWININWFLLRGFERYGFTEQADHLRATTIRLVRDRGFYEYFNPLTGRGHGSDFFSWTAALLLDVLLEE
jgi:glycogen debranching enzyme